MKILLIDINCKDSSTGRIVYELYQAVNKRENDVAAVCYGRGKKIKEPNVFKFGLDVETSIHALLTRLTGYTGCFSPFSTLRLICYIKKFKPDVVHIHELHAYFVNIKPLINFLKKNKIKTVMTLHCEFIYTGKCGYSVECENWKKKCGNCPHLKDYPATLFFDHTQHMLKIKKEIFYGYENLLIVTPSTWLANRVKYSFLKNYALRVIHNGIDTNIFYPREVSSLRHKCGIKEDEKVVLSLAADLMRETKGGKYVLQLAEMMRDEKIRFILIGVDEDIQSEYENVMIHGRLSDKNMIAQYYSLADAFLICSRDDNFPTTCLEAQCCGTPVCGFDVGGVKETLIDDSGLCKYGDMNALQSKLKQILMKKDDDIAEKAAKCFGNATMVESYMKLYRDEEK